MKRGHGIVPLTRTHPRIKIGVTGSMQSGKQELGKTWRKLGYAFVDLNPLADRARVEHRAAYEALGLDDGLGEDGKENGKFYAKILADPRLHRATMEIELPFVANAIEGHLAMLPQGTSPIVLSWGYLHQLFTLGVKVDHVILCRPARTTWVSRIQRRAAELGWRGMTETQVDNMAKILELAPDEVMEAVISAYPDDHSILDTTPEDFGAENLQHLIHTFWD